MVINTGFIILNVLKFYLLKQNLNFLLKVMQGF